MAVILRASSYELCPKAHSPAARNDKGYGAAVAVASPSKQKGPAHLAQPKLEPYAPALRLGMPEHVQPSPCLERASSPKAGDSSARERRRITQFFPASCARPSALAIWSSNQERSFFHWALLGAMATSAAMITRPLCRAASASAA